MQKSKIYQQLKDQHQEMMSYLHSLDQEQIHQQVDGKWSALQNVDHLLKSVKVVNPAVRKPSILLRSAFGKPNREARTYEALVQRYQEKLKDGKAQSPKEYQAADSKDMDAQSILQDYDNEMQTFLKFVAKVKERKLDRTLLPHPLLGRLLMREVLYFMHYHTDHHLAAIKKSVVQA